MSTISKSPRGVVSCVRLSIWSGTRLQIPLYNFLQAYDFSLTCRNHGNGLSLGKRNFFGIHDPFELLFRCQFICTKLLNSIYSFYQQQAPGTFFFIWRASFLKHSKAYLNKMVFLQKSEKDMTHHRWKEPQDVQCLQSNKQ